MILTDDMLETQTAPDLGRLLAHELVAPMSSVKTSALSSLLRRGAPTGSWRFRDRLDTSALDYSVESLAAIDRHLESVHDSLPEGEDGKDIEALGLEQLHSSIPTIGCYVGEVLRRNGAGDYEWTYHQEYLRRHPEQIELLGPAPQLSTVLVLASESGALLFPLGKVFKFLLDGPADATQTLAYMVVNPS